VSFLYRRTESSGECEDVTRCSHRVGDYHQWKALLSAAGVRDGRLHDARRTAATVLLLLGVPERAVMGIMGWSTTAMAARYQHLTEAVRRDIADRVGGLLWANPVRTESGRDEPSDGLAEVLDLT
jgi:integrase